MSFYAVVAREVSMVVWQGEASDGPSACAKAARLAGPPVTAFTPYEFASPSHDEDGLERLVLTVYRLAQAPAAGSPKPDWSELSDDDYVGTYMAVVHH